MAKRGGRPLIGPDSYTSLHFSTKHFLVRHDSAFSFIYRGSNRSLGDGSIHPTGEFVGP